MNIDTIRRAREVWGDKLIVITDNQYVAFTGHGRYMIMDDDNHCVYSFRPNSDNTNRDNPIKGKIFDYDEIQFIDREMTYDEMISKFGKLLSDGVITQNHYNALVADATVAFKDITGEHYTDDESVDTDTTHYIGNLNGFSQSIPDINKIFKDRGIKK